MSWRAPIEASPAKETARERKLAVLAGSAVGKTTLRGKLQSDTRLGTKLVADVDAFLPTAMQQDPYKILTVRRRQRPAYWRWAELHAVQAILKKRVDIVFGVMSDRRSRALLEGHGFEFLVLSVPEAVHRARLEELVRAGRGSGVDVQECLAVQRHLESLGYEAIDAARPVEEVSDRLARRAARDGKDGRLAVIGAPGTGKSTLAQSRNSRRFQKDRALKTKLALELDAFLPARPAELSAVEAVLAKTVDVVFGVMHHRSPRELLERNGYECVVLSLPESMHRERIQRRLGESRSPVDVEWAVAGQRELEALGYETIDASGTADETAEHLAQRLLEPPPERR
jgi:GTPase SAR1 family protein